jgi:hypothetical protein
LPALRAKGWPQEQELVLVLVRRLELKAELQAQRAPVSRAGERENAAAWVPVGARARASPTRPAAVEVVRAAAPRVAASRDARLED